MDAGAAGYLLKEVRLVDLVAALRRVVAGERIFAPAATPRSGPDPGDDGLPVPLTVQEERILDLISEGLTNRQIAELMYLSEKTVKNYVSRVLAKLGMARRAEAAAYAARRAERQRPTVGRVATA
jgi:DNA-binding NarL/FixJ family response regulator